MLRALVAASLLLMAASLPLLVAGSARAEVESERVRAGVAAAERLEYQRASVLLQQALGESLTREEKLVTYRTLGTCYVALDRLAEARQSFERLLTIDPTIELDVRVSPRVRAVFEEARAEVAQHGRELPPAHRLPELSPRLDPPQPREGAPLTVTLVHPGGIARRAALLFRRHGSVEFTRSEADVDDAGRVQLVAPGDKVVPPALDYYALMLDDSGTAVARAGSLAAPLTVRVTPRPVPLRRRAWFWGVIGGAAGVLVIGAITTGVVLSSPTSVTINPR